MGKKKKQKFNTNQNNFPGPHRQIKKAKSHYLHPSYLALQEQMRNEWIAKQTPKPTATTVVSQPNITPICVQPSAPSNFQVNRTIAVRNKEATVTGYKVPSITIAVVNTSCSNESSSASDEKKVSSSCMVDNVSGAVKDSSSCVDSNMEVFNDGISSSTGDVLEVSGVSSEQFEIGCQPENSCDDDDVIILDDKGTESEITAENNVQQTSKKPEVIVLDDTLQDSEIEKSDTDSDVVFVSKQTLSFEVPNKKATGNLPSFIPLELNSSLNHVPASELISRWRKSMENKSQQKNQRQVSSANSKQNTCRKNTQGRKFKKRNFERQLANLKVVETSVNETNPSPLRIDPNQTTTTNPSFGNLHNAGSVRKVGLREIIIDGSNVAFQHGHQKNFSVEGLKICIDYFLKRGHKVRAFIPQFRLKRKQSSNPKLLEKLCDQKYVVCTPSREVDGKLICSYDDRFIVECAAVLEGIIVSSDNYKDLWQENPNLRETILKRLLMPTFVDDMIIFPNDPLGRDGPTLDEFLRFPPENSEQKPAPSINSAANLA